MRETYGLDNIYYSGEKLSQLIIGHQECQQEEKLDEDQELEENIQQEEQEE